MLALDLPHAQEVSIGAAELCARVDLALTPWQRGFLDAVPRRRPTTPTGLPESITALGARLTARVVAARPGYATPDTEGLGHDDV
jgi:hypothetical protein